MRGGSSGKTSRRCWTPDEERVLANALKELILHGWKADNGFRTGYQNLLEQTMIQAFPGTNIRADPHINSCIHVWRRNYGTLSSMKSRSGFGWNDTTNMVTVDNEQIFENFAKTDSNARAVRFKPWPLYKDWVEIFGKDRANGESAEGFTDVVQELLNKDHDVNVTNADLGSGVGDPLSKNATVQDAESMSASPGNAGSSSKNSLKGKRKLGDEVDCRFLDLMESFRDKTDNRLSDISKRIGFEHDASLSRKAVFQSIGDVIQLDLETMISVSHLIVNNTKNMDLFYSLPSEGRKVMVTMMVEGRFPSQAV